MPRARLLISLLAFAAILNVTFAWGCVLWSPYNVSYWPVDKGDGSYPEDVVGPDGSRGSWLGSGGFGIFESAPYGSEGAEGYFNSWKGRYTPAYYRAGWPMLSMQSIVNNYNRANGVTLAKWNLPKMEIFRRGLQTDSLPTQFHAQGDRRIPLMPMWSGFGVNTFLLFALLWMLRSLWIRRIAPYLPKFGRQEDAGKIPCPRCGYDLRATPNQCPECGQIPL
jgi:hypothetical protein